MCVGVLNIAEVFFSFSLNLGTVVCLCVNEYCSKGLICLLDYFLVGLCLDLRTLYIWMLLCYTVVLELFPPLIRPDSRVTGNELVQTQRSNPGSGLNSGCGSEAGEPCCSYYYAFHFFHWSLWQPIEQYGGKLWMFAHTLGMAPSLIWFLFNFMSASQAL